MDESSTNPTGDPIENVQADDTAAAQTGQHTDSYETVKCRRHRPLMIGWARSFRWRVRIAAATSG